MHGKDDINEVLNVNFGKMFLEVGTGGIYMIFLVDFYIIIVTFKK